MAKFCKHETFWRQPLKVFVRTRLKCQRAIYLQSSLGVVITTFCSRHKYAAKTCLQIAQQAERWVLHAQLMAPDRQEDCVHVISSSIQCGRMEHSIFGRQWLCMEAKMTPINRPTGLSEAGGGGGVYSQEMFTDKHSDWCVRSNSFLACGMWSCMPSNFKRILFHNRVWSVSWG